MDTTVAVVEDVRHAHNVAAWMHGSDVAVELGSRSSTNEADAVVQPFLFFVGSISGTFYVEVASSRVVVVCDSIATRPFLWKASSYLVRLGPQKSERSLDVDVISSVLRVADSQLQFAAVTRSVVIDVRKLSVSLGSRFSVAVTNTTATLLADCRAMFRIDREKMDLEGDGARAVALVHVDCIECYRVDLAVSDVAVTASIVLDNAPNQSQALIGPLGGGDVLLVLTSISCLVTVTGAVHNAEMQVSRCSLNATVKQTSARPLAFLSYVCTVAAAFFISSVSMDSLALRVVNCTMKMRTSVAVRPLTAVESTAMRSIVKLLVNKNDPDEASGASGLGALSSMVAFVVASVSSVAGTDVMGGRISVLESQLLMPSGSSINGSVGEWRAAFIVADVSSMLFRLGQTNAFVRQPFERYVTARRRNQGSSAVELLPAAESNIPPTSIGCRRRLDLRSAAPLEQRTAALWSETLRSASALYLPELLLFPLCVG